ncbi:MAG: APC family permease [Hyphomicrobiales bacterium]
MLVFYGVGVTVGAGIFALIGEILAIAGDFAPLSFLIAGAVAGVTAFSYSLLVPRFPRAGGEAVYVNRALGQVWARLIGYGIVVAGIVSSSVIAIAFAGYLQVFVHFPSEAIIVLVVGVLAATAWFGVKESIYVAAVITVLEVVVLLVIVFAGIQQLKEVPQFVAGLGHNWTTFSLSAVLSAALLAFFAFIGFEDIANMAEETVEPEKTIPKAIVWTLIITVAIYVSLSLIAVLAQDRSAITSSSAPLAALFSQLTGMSGNSIAAAASVAMINGILVQMVMASRVLYGMSNEGIAPAWLNKVSETRKTPARATFLVAIAILGLALFFPLVKLAEITSLLVLGVFASVNLSLFLLARGAEKEALGKYKWWGFFGSILCLVIATFEVVVGGGVH